MSVKIKYPKNETVWVTYYGVNGEPICILTSKSVRNFYFLYEVLSDGELNKLGKAHSPIELEEKFNVKERMTKANY